MRVCGCGALISPAARLRGRRVLVDRRIARGWCNCFERRRDKFVLVDHSSNGTYVTVEGQGELAVRREELTLRGRGHMSFGHAVADDPSECASFSCVD